MSVLRTTGYAQGPQGCSEDIERTVRSEIQALHGPASVLLNGHRSRRIIGCKMGETLLTHFVGASEQRGRQLQAKSSCRVLVQDQLEFGRGLNGQLGRTGTP
jgi:hypothetical protein